jgi:HD superfamily phosphohydrolase
MFKDISDPIYQFIRLYPKELKVIDSFVFSEAKVCKAVGGCTYGFSLRPAYSL